MKKKKTSVHKYVKRKLLGWGAGADRRGSCSVIGWGAGAGGGDPFHYMVEV